MDYFVTSYTYLETSRFLLYVRTGSFSDKVYRPCKLLFLERLFAGNWPPFADAKALHKKGLRPRDLFLTL